MIQPEDQCDVISARAEAKWNELDVDQSGTLEGEEVAVLAEWVWCGFRPGQKISAGEKENEIKKIMAQCDKNSDGCIDWWEFKVYYDEIVADITLRRNLNLQRLEKVAQQAVENFKKKPAALPKMTDKEKVSVLDGKAKDKWDELDLNQNGTLEGEEIMLLAEWVWCSFRPGKTISDTQRMSEATKIMRRCDKNDDEKIDKEEFKRYYDNTVKDILRWPIVV